MNEASELRAEIAELEKERDRLKEELEDVNCALRDAESDSRACLKLSLGLSDRFPEGYPPRLPSAVDTALAVIDRFKAALDMIPRLLVRGDILPEGKAYRVAERMAEIAFNAVHGDRDEKAV